MYGDRKYCELSLKARDASGRLSLRRLTHLQFFTDIYPPYQHFLLASFDPAALFSKSTEIAELPTWPLA
jgi:hypothetical protein